MKKHAPITRKEMVRLLNEDLAREFQAIIAYTVYSQTIKGAKYKGIADELKLHAGEELEHALQITKQIDYFNGCVGTGCLDTRQRLIRRLRG